MRNEKTTKNTKYNGNFKNHNFPNKLLDFIIN